MFASRFHQGMMRRYAVFALLLVVALTASGTGQEAKSPAKPVVAKGEVVTELDKAIWHVFQAQNKDYWFGSSERGVYRYNGKTLVNYTVKDGLVSNSIGGFQEDKAGNIYITNDSISKFDGQAFTTLRVAKDAVTTDWKLRADDLWFPGPNNTGVVYRYDGQSLYPLAFPKTKDGDDHYIQVPRDKYPNAKYSPYDVFSMFKDSKGNLWFGTAILGVCRYDGKSFTWLPETDLRNGSFGTRAIIEDKDGRFWFCNTLHRYAVDLTKPAAPSFRKEKGLDDAKNPSQPALVGIMSSTVDRNGAMWVATYGDGVWRYDGKDLTHYPVTDGGKPITLFSIHKDTEGVMWVGTHSAGAYRFNGKTFEKFKP